MAQIFKRSNHWSARIRWYDSDGKRHSKSQDGFTTKALAKQWALEKQMALNNGLDISKTISLTDYYWEWVKTYKEPKLSSKTLNRYNNVGKRLESYFNKTNIKEIKRTHYQKFINQYGSNHAPSSVKKLNSIIRSCVKSAILDDYITKDFTQNISLTADKDRSLNVEYPNIKEIKQILNQTINGITNRRYTSRYMIVTAIYTGMRKEEIQALTWNDIDFIHHIINIDKAWKETKDKGETDEHFKTHRFKPTKNESSVRKIKVNQKLLQLLHRLKINAPSNLVFMNQFGTIPTSGPLNEKLHEIMSELHIEKDNFHFHSLRHSHVALLLANDIDLYVISKRLGHNNISTTTDTYAYLIDEYRQKSNDKIISVLNQM
ncbi:tyrosine-type recombinase/integrase [Limosilactobacillus caviae]|jgi:integrase|uniref:Site-specific integrase n=1 Tax=Limosilactobacillus caviae TaxID=1769424 RepID=A0ABQ2CBP6_9LACO|nr:tyrosine-type recombinase/integrase [Limosilactobacillus caviae]MCD7125150.1 site-specific integrase [Limosilactobacillus caviae]MRH47242.1 tyrosine-type recombinase/integrase [Limosilactobacillus reuteri]GGI64209.1 site-specific integrase [Limosilactobacillus caviae]